jgi:hypothetical protein
MGAFINLNSSSVTSFSIKPPSGYIYPQGLASCMSRLEGRPAYVEVGGTSFQASKGTGRDVMSKGLFVMDASSAVQQHPLVAAAGGDVVPQRAQAALACGPDGRLFIFGGLAIGGQSVGPEGPGTYVTAWQPTNALVTLKLGGSVSSPRVSKDGEAAAGSSGPSPRSGAALVYMPAAVVSALGMSQGALLLYGGSSINATNMEQFDLNDRSKPSRLAARLRGTSWDTSTWLYDLGGRKWLRLATQGAAPPGLMYHSMEASGRQVVLFGGQAYTTSSAQVRLSTMLYVLDFSSNPPMWRTAAIQLNAQGAFQLDFPNTGLVMLPEFGAVALKHRSVRLSAGQTVCHCCTECVDAALQRAARALAQCWHSIVWCLSC